RPELLSQRTGSLQGPVGNHDTLDALLMQMTRDQRDGFASANQQGLTAVQIREDLLGQADGGKGNRNRVLADGSICTDGFCSAERGLEQAPQKWPKAPRLARNGIGGLHMTENLRQAKHNGVQYAGDAHHESHRLLINMNVG